MPRSGTGILIADRSAHFNTGLSDLGGFVFSYVPTVAGTVFLFAWQMGNRDLTNGGVGNLPASLALYTGALGARFLAGNLRYALGDDNPLFATPQALDGPYSHENEAVMHVVLTTVGGLVAIIGLIRMMFSYTDNPTVCLVGMDIMITEGIHLFAGTGAHLLGQTTAAGVHNRINAACGAVNTMLANTCARPAAETRAEEHTATATTLLDNFLNQVGRLCADSTRSLRRGTADNNPMVVELIEHNSAAGAENATDNNNGNSFSNCKWW